MIPVHAVLEKNIKSVAADKMTLLILAAGFGTRLEPLTCQTPKQLLPISGGVIMDLFYHSIKGALPFFSKRILITNKIYFEQFKNWARPYSIKVLSNGVENKKDKIGAIGDFLLAIEKENVDRDVFVAAPDYILSNIDFTKVIEYLKEKKASITIFKKEKDLELIKSGSCLKINSAGRIIKFEEKPEYPFSDNYGIPYYLVKQRDIDRIRNIPMRLRDNSGQIVAELVRSSKVYGFKYSGKVVHLTTKKDYEMITKEEKVEKST